MDPVLRALEREFTRMLAEDGAEASPPRDICFRNARHRHQIDLRILLENGREHCIAFYEDVFRCERWRLSESACRQLLHDARTIWARMYEDHLVRQRTAAQCVALQSAQRICASPEMVARLREEREHAECHAHAYHNFGFDPARPSTERSVYALRQASMTATEALERGRANRRITEDAMRRIGAEMDAHHLRLMDFLTAHGEGPAPPLWMEEAYAFADGEIGTEDARKKGLALLKENLTPEQRAQYEAHKYFDVKGGESGKTYRIHHGRQMNIADLGGDGKPVRGLCFLPQGGLVAGDVMLAQKTALEVCESEALKVANPFALPPGSRLNPHPRREGMQHLASTPALPEDSRLRTRWYGLTRMAPPRGGGIVAMTDGA